MDVEKLDRQTDPILEGRTTMFGELVRVPSPEAEDSRQLHRELEVLKEEKKTTSGAHSIAMYTQGNRREGRPKFSTKLRSCAAGIRSPYRQADEDQDQDEYHRLQLVEAQIREVKARRSSNSRLGKRGRHAEGANAGSNCGIGWARVGILMELFGWRQFQNRREVAGAVGLTPTPYNSGDSVREQGISRAGNRRVRKLTIEIAWPGSVSNQQQVSAGTSNDLATERPMRRIGIVAMARRLVIDSGVT